MVKELTTGIIVTARILWFALKNELIGSVVSSSRISTGGVEYRYKVTTDPIKEYYE
jgi:hypothetical protein